MASGLDLEVFDQYTGTTRAISTLSGGDSCLASLALALGLSDVVQSHAGGIRLDAIFIDEGFGTLDPEALDFDIRALKDLQQAGRMVGIILHVAELKEWIDARLTAILKRVSLIGSAAQRQGATIAKSFPTERRYLHGPRRATRTISNRSLSRN